MHLSFLQRLDRIDADQQDRSKIAQHFSAGFAAVNPESPRDDRFMGKWFCRPRRDSVRHRRPPSTEVLGYCLPAFQSAPVHAAKFKLDLGACLPQYVVRSHDDGWVGYV